MTTALAPLWVHQERALGAARQAAASGARGLLLQCPTGGGKTRLGLEIALGVVRRGGTVHWFAHRDELVEQPLGKLRAAGAPVGLLGDGAPITILSVQTACRRGEAVGTATLAVFDEARHYVAPQWGTVAARYVASGALRVGLDATPAGAGGASLRGLFDVLLPVATIAELTSAGVLVPSFVYGPDSATDDLSENPVAAYLGHPAGAAREQAIVFCASVSHAETVAAEFCAAGIEAVCLEGAMALGQRRAAVERFMDGTLRVLTNVFCLTEGTDLPPASVVLWARGCSSEATWIQGGGRGLRRNPAPGSTKARCIIIDLRGSFHKFGGLDEERVWSLDGEPVRRVEALPPVRQCRECLAWGAPSSVCRQCGATLPAPKAPRITKRLLREQRIARTPQEGADWHLWVRLVGEARARGHKPQAPALRFKAATGRWPRWDVASVPPEAVAEVQRVG